MALSDNCILRLYLEIMIYFLSHCGILKILVDPLLDLILPEVSRPKYIKLVFILFMLSTVKGLNSIYFLDKCSHPIFHFLLCFRSLHRVI
jgi:hypothetical protein